MQYIRMAITICLALAIGACGIARQVESGRTKKQLLHLQVGMDRDAVLLLMGKPDVREAYGDAEFLFYETNHWANEEHRRYTPILLKDGKVVGWGQKYYIDSTGQKNRNGMRGGLP